MEPEDRNSNDELDTGQWTDRRLSALAPAGDWEPNLTRGLALLRERKQNRGGRARKGIWGFALALATCASLMAAPIARTFAERCLSACVSEAGWLRQWWRTGRSGVVPGSVSVQPGDRKLAPEFALSDAAGRRVRLSDFRGHPVLLNFWATWCAPCRLEIPTLMDFQRAHRAEGLVVLGISLDEEGWSAVRPYIEARRVNYDVLLADDKTADLFGGLKAVPTTFLIDKYGRIAATHLGLCQPGEYEADIEALLRE